MTAAARPTPRGAAPTAHPTQVEIVAPAPVPVTVVDRRARVEPKPGADGSLPATTTVQEDMVLAGQRHINAIWERTQQIIALFVTTVTLAACAWLAVMGKPEMQTPAFLLLSNVFFLVVGTYFQRTNHTKQGGTGSAGVSQTGDR